VKDRLVEGGKRGAVGKNEERRGNTEGNRRGMQLKQRKNKKVTREIFS